MNLAAHLVAAAVRPPSSAMGEPLPPVLTRHSFTLSAPPEAPLVARQLLAEKSLSFSLR
jgi:hypothetical protein